MKLRQSLFWDTDIKNIDLKKHNKSVIERIITRGHWEEFKDLLRFYGKEQVRETVLNLRYLDKVTLSFCSTVFDVPKPEFRCYKLAQSNPEHWHY